MKLHELIYNYNESIGNRASAFDAFKRFNQIKDSISNAKKSNSQSEALREVKEREKRYEIDLLLRSKKLSNFYIYVAVGISVLAIFITIIIYKNFTKNKIKNEIISRQKEALEESNREKDRILNVVAHDLRSPLSGIVYWVEMALSESGSNSVKDAQNRIRSTSLKSLALINELVGNKDNNTINVKFEETNITDLLIDVIQSLKYKAIDKNQQLIGDLVNEPVYWYVNKEKLYRAITNLVENAIKFTPLGGIILLTVNIRSGKLNIKISDNGIGIPNHLKQQLFDIFSSSKRLGTKGEKSFGLGLSITKQIVEEHYGTLIVNSVEGEGSEFTIELPAMKFE
jgi:signal transduction histidine kinase